MGEYVEDRVYSDQFIDEIKQIIGPILLEPAPYLLDIKEATDLIMMHARSQKIACRVRRPGYAERFPNDITFRFWRASGVETEWPKIQRGFVDLYFYGIACRYHPGKFARWSLVNVPCFFDELAMLKPTLRKGKDWGINLNPDRRTSLIWFNLITFSRAVIASGQTELPGMNGQQTSFDWDDDDPVPL